MLQKLKKDNDLKINIDFERQVKAPLRSSKSTVKKQKNPVVLPNEERKP